MSLPQVSQMFAAKNDLMYVSSMLQMRN